MTTPWLMTEIPENKFPFRVMWLRGDEVVYEVEVPSPGAVSVPAMGEITRCRVEFADGTVIEGAAED